MKPKTHSNFIDKNTSSVQDNYIYNDIIIEKNQQNIYIDLEKKIKSLKLNWNNKERFYSVLKEMDNEILGENIYEDEISNYPNNQIEESYLQNNLSRSYLGLGNQNQNETSFVSNTNRNK